MYEVKVLNKSKKIMLLKWAGIVKKEDVSQVNTLLNQLHEEIGKGKFYLLVDCSDLQVFAPETKDLIIEQQKMFIPHIIKVASVMQKTLTKIQLKETRDKAGNHVETQFETYDEALHFLEKQ